MVRQREHLGDHQQEQACPQHLAEGGIRVPTEGADDDEEDPTQSQSRDGGIGGVADEQRAVEKCSGGDGDEADRKDDPGARARAQQRRPQRDEGRAGDGDEEGREFNRESDLYG